jgi:hypothetical protein
VSVTWGGHPVINGDKSQVWREGKHLRKHNSYGGVRRQSPDASVEHVLPELVPDHM